MKCLQTAMFVLLIFAICAILGTHSSTAQQFSSRSASSTISSAGATTATAAPAATAAIAGSDLDPLFGSTSEVRAEELNPLPEADRAHAESTRRLQAQYQATTDPDERRKLSEDLEQVITEHFEIRQRIRAQELEELHAQIRRLQELHDRREQEKNQIISDRLRQLLRDAEGLGWGPSDSGSTFGPGAQGHPFVQPPRSTRSVLPATAR